MDESDETFNDNLRMVFGWYRRRLANARALANVPAPEAKDARAASYVPEQHVLIGCALDAIAIDWAHVYRQDLTQDGASSANRFSEFLYAHANASGIFSRVAAPMLVDWLKAEGEAQVADKFAYVVGDVRSGIVRNADEDPLFSKLENDPSVTALQLPPSKPNGKPRSLPLRSYRFGEVLYREYRCWWAHNFRGSPKLASSDTNQWMGWRDQDRTVRYQNYSQLREESGAVHQISMRRPVFSMEWLFGIYEQAVDSFEKQCRADRKDPTQYIPLD